MNKKETLIASKNIFKLLLRSGLNYSVRSNGVCELKTKDINTSLMTNFYKISPFPNYNNYETILDLVEKQKQNNFIRKLTELLSHNKLFLEVGSGTSQLSLTLAYTTNNRIIAMDPTIESLNLGEKFAKNNNIRNCHFIKSDIQSNPFKKNLFDFVWCSGVLHHTKEPYNNFKTIINWLKPEGIVIIGLYNKYGRILTNLRQIIFKIFKKSNFAVKLVSILDPYITSDLSNSKKQAWVRDQYMNPIESVHTIDEVLKWFNENNIEFLYSIPSANFSDLNFSKMFHKNNQGTFMRRLFSQLGMIFNSMGSEGGLFIMIGKKVKK